MSELTIPTKSIDLFSHISEPSAYVLRFDDGWEKNSTGKFRVERQGMLTRIYKYDPKTNRLVEVVDKKEKQK